MKIARHDEDKQVDYNNNIAMRLVRRIVPDDRPSTTARSCSPAENAKRVATPLFAVLVLIEATDVVFAVDSVPAILAVSREPFIVFASNAFAILGLRVAVLPARRDAGPVPLPQHRASASSSRFVGIKMLLIGDPFEVHLPTYVSLGFIAVVLTVSILWSVRADRRERAVPEMDVSER